MTTSGARANTSGRILETYIANVIKQWLGLDPIPHAIWSKNKHYPALVSDVPFQTIYNTSGRSEFVLFYSDQSGIRVECKWQAVSGSVDEKYPYLLECMKRVPEKYVFIVTGGGGAKRAAIEWLTQSAKVTESKYIRVMDMDSFTQILQNISKGK